MSEPPTGITHDLTAAAAKGLGDRRDLISPREDTALSLLALISLATVLAVGAAVWRHRRP